MSGFLRSGTIWIGIYQVTQAMYSHSQGGQIHVKTLHAISKWKLKIYIVTVITTSKMFIWLIIQRKQVYIWVCLIFLFLQKWSIWVGKPSIYCCFSKNVVADVSYWWKVLVTCVHVLFCFCFKQSYFLARSLVYNTFKFKFAKNLNQR